jgi:group II intron reverse transcriptase/maturase
MELERRDYIVRLLFSRTTSDGKILLDKVKPFDISKRLIWDAFKKVKANQGAAGVDDQSIEEFENDLRGNLYKLWNRMSSGSYIPPPVRRVEIPKSGGGKRPLGIPTVSDRVAQMAAKMVLEPELEPHFHPDSYGYRPNKSAIEAVGVTRQRCWKFDWVVDLDIRAFFDSMDHTLLLRAVYKHTDCKWLRLYIERWLKAPAQLEDGTLIPRDRGTPQGGVISPLLANLFLHYGFDRWMRQTHPDIPFERYADDGVVHCRTEAAAQLMMKAIGQRLAECGLELHPEKTKIVYCKDGRRRKDYPTVKFDFLGYSFQPRQAKSHRGNLFLNFSPAVSAKAAKSIRSTIRSWKIHRWTQLSIEEIAASFNPVLRGWINYYGSYYRSMLAPILGQLDYALDRWTRRKYKRLKGSPTKARTWVKRLARQNPGLFAHWAITRPAMAE